MELLGPVTHEHNEVETLSSKGGNSVNPAPELRLTPEWLAVLVQGRKNASVLPFPRRNQGGGGKEAACNVAAVSKETSSSRVSGIACGGEKM